MGRERVQKVYRAYSYSEVYKWKAGSKFVSHLGEQISEYFPESWVTSQTKLVTAFLAHSRIRDKRELLNLNKTVSEPGAIVIEEDEIKEVL